MLLIRRQELEKSLDINQGTRSAEIRYDISNMDANETLVQIIRRHWENKTFYKNLDTMSEDDENAEIDK